MHFAASSENALNMLHGSQPALRPDSREMLERRGLGARTFGVLICLTPRSKLLFRLCPYLH